MTELEALELRRALGLEPRAPAYVSAQTLSQIAHLAGGMGATMRFELVPVADAVALVGVVGHDRRHLQTFRAT